LREGSPFQTIIQTAGKESVDLIVVGAHGRKRNGYVLIGNIAKRLIKESPCPVLVVGFPGKEKLRNDYRAFAKDDVSEIFR
jgi:nucleotide-binding universal stress UspA family protein